MSGEANIWNPRTLIELSADTKSVEQRLTANLGQSLFTITDFVYVINTGALQVYQNGLLLAKGFDWIEQTASTFSLVVPANGGDEIVAVGSTGITGNVDVRDTDIYVPNYQAVRDYAGTEVTVYSQGKVALGDTGEHFFQLVTGAAIGFYVDDNAFILVPAGGNGSSAWIREKPTSTDNFDTMAEVEASTDNLRIYVGATLRIGDRNDAIFKVKLLASVVANTFQTVALTGLPTLAVDLNLTDTMSLLSFGGVASAGEDISVATRNGLALQAAVQVSSGPVNSTASTTSKSRKISLGSTQWNIGDVDLSDRWGWQVDCKNSKLYISGNWLLGGCAFFDLKLGYCQPIAANSQTQNFISMIKSVVGLERVHNFYISFKFMGEFLAAFTGSDNWSQGVIQGGQFNGNIKCITSDSGGENVVLKDWIFAGHVANTSEIVYFKNSNVICSNWQFETLPDNDRNDIRLDNCFGIKFPGLLMTTSGGIRIEGGFGSIQGAGISNSIASTVINHISGSEWQIEGNGIRWDLNNGTGTAFTDGTGKTAIATAVGLAVCAQNKIRRADTGIKSTAIGTQSYDANSILDPKTQAFLLEGADNAAINGGTISLDNGVAKGVTVTGTNGSGNKVNNVQWGSSPTADRYNISAGNGQNLIVFDGGVGDPEALGIKGGTGSMWSDNGGAVGAAVYVKGLFGTGADNWNPVGILLRTQAQLLAKADFSNTVGKHRARQAMNTNTSQILYAAGTADIDVWNDSDGTLVLTPV